MAIEQIKEFFRQEFQIFYPLDAIELINEIQVGKVFPVTNQINDYVIPGFLISCDIEICNYYGIKFPPPTPNLKFRMADLLRKDYLIEVILFFQDNKIMKLHLNPSNKIVRHYLKTGIETNVISFHFFNQERGEIIDSITDLNDEEQSWFIRNYKLAKSLKVNKKYNQLSKLI